ncbi:glycosyltransferase family 2 protein [Cellulomonas wangsupingiae]|uniref:Glycosyltransferase n=1 Tax=Cellulomonas wangsupingiae TaxID=2968085 RepID=A0ABY5K2A1_9CELL|nr:glycosyltransferase family 2 protein [Cellulomonas wangsupingiae]MCC2335683.1 glycosyltransferase [Cellulomonas wangsupingiae]UUI63918.1 glycosyltransferase [Cellulomonas wangsupingiae]
MSRVSVVVPAYRNAEHVGATLDSILAQTYDDFDVVVADHGSDDGTWEVLEPYADDPRVTLRRTPAGGGARRNWDAVSQAAGGELLKLVCGDDLLHPRALERQVAALDAAGPGATVVACRRDLVDARGEVFLRGRGLAGMRGRVDGRRALRTAVRSGGNPLGEPACVLLRRDALASAGWWDDSQPYYIDLGTYAHLLLRGDLVAVDETLASFRVSASQWSVRLAAEQHAQARAFNARMHALAPEAVREVDVRVGDVRAGVAALQRRVAYAVLGRRMTARPAAAG